MVKWLVGLMVAAMMIETAFAHPGGTDGGGGHYDRTTGDYHYHHGYSAHDHVDGVCPYNYDDKTGESSGTSSSSSSSSSNGSLTKDYDQARLTSIYRTFQKGDRGNAVADLQRRLNTLGYSAGEPDGIFGSQTEVAVKQFQQDNGINATGNVSYVTLKLLFPELVPTATTKPTASPTTQPSHAAVYRSSEKRTDYELPTAGWLALAVHALLIVIIVVCAVFTSRRKKYVIREEIDSIEKQLALINAKAERSKLSKARVAEVREITEKIRSLLREIE